MSRYDVLANRTVPTTEPIRAGKASSRRGNSSFRQFSAYIPIELYRKLKVRLAERDLDLSEGVEQAVTDWLAKETSTK